MKPEKEEKRVRLVAGEYGKIFYIEDPEGKWLLKSPPVDGIEYQMGLDAICQLPPTT